MLGRRKRKDARVVDAARGQLSTAEINARAVLATAMTPIELPASRVLEERERLQASTETAIEPLLTRSPAARLTLQRH